MIAGVYNIYCEQGATFERTFTITNPDGTVYDLSGFNARMHVRKEPDSTTTYVELTQGNGRIEIVPTFGEIRINLSAETTAGLSRDGVYDLEIYNGSGVVHRVVQGQFRVSKEVTK
jgi:hypothetical protein